MASRKKSKKTVRRVSKKAAHPHTKEILVVVLVGWIIVLMVLFRG